MISIEVEENRVIVLEPRNIPGPLLTVLPMIVQNFDINVSGAVYISQNKDTVNLLIGTAVAGDVSGSGFVRANALFNSKFCIGLLSANVDQNTAGPIQTEGVLLLTDWTAITGTATLAAKAKYYLDIIAGKITTIAPSSPGQIVQRIGVALDSLTLSINIGESISL
jgi:hypothetical protein